MSYDAVIDLLVSTPLSVDTKTVTMPLGYTGWFSMPIIVMASSGLIIRGSWKSRQNLEIHHVFGVFVQEFW